MTCEYKMCENAVYRAATDGICTPILFAIGTQIIYGNGDDRVRIGPAALSFLAHRMIMHAICLKTVRAFDIIAL